MRVSFAVCVGECVYVCVCVCVYVYVCVCGMLSCAATCVRSLSLLRLSSYSF